ncbi:SulP family inorganic anion transporter [Pseudovibrio sp. Tun.PSC04-5.I4]|uniref:SulP family inorganic anion transporter n=1 Tax=Pseudovibrio sp. Tun.PSC04-5.I4 TaxID=1798213 RepID=UPI000AE54FB6|nr:SulP family inorganic anion transporter [Pseudovibrio sp. Tun.PSC04-5.I4]
MSASSLRGIRERVEGLPQVLFPFLVWWPQVNRETLRSDVIAAITGATIVLPQGIAFAAIAGLPAQYGLYTAMITPIAAALFGSSMYLVSGPTTAISALLLAALAGKYTPGSEAYVSAALALTLMVGLIQFGFGLARLGRLVSFVSHSVMIGFTAGAAILIGLSQVRHALGISLPRPEHLFEFVLGVVDAIPQIHGLSLIIAAVTLITAVIVRIYRPKWPNYVLALVVGGGLSFLLDGAGNGVKGVGIIPSVFPEISLPTNPGATFKDLSQSALAIAIIGLLEAVSIAKALSLKGNTPLDSNQEIVGQGLSNIFGSFFSAYVGSGSFTRSGLNYEAGAKTPLAAIMSSIILLMILFLVAPLFAYLPIPAMAGAIILVAYKLIDFKTFRHLIISSKSETMIARIQLASATLPTVCDVRQRCPCVSHRLM